MRAEKRRAPMSKKTMPVKKKLNKSSSLVSIVFVSSFLFLRSLFITRYAVAKAKTYMSPYHRNKPRKGMLGNICGCIHEG
jgi:hypothetical protein